MNIAIRLVAKAKKQTKPNPACYWLTLYIVTCAPSEL